MDDSQHQQTLQERLSRLQQQHDLETRVEEQMRLEQLINKTCHALSNQLQQEAHRCKRKGAYRDAIMVWHKIQFYTPNQAGVAQEISELEQLLAQTTKVAELIKHLSRIKALRHIFKDLSNALKQTANTAEYSTLWEQVVFFLHNDEPDVEGFMLWWENERPTTPTHVQNVDISRLAGRVQKGEVVLFLGSDLVSAYCDEPHEERALIEQLAKQIGYTHFDGTLSSIAECYQLRPDLGLTSLLDNLRQFLPDADRIINLYHVLAKINPPLILISSGYDNLLASTFQAAGKKFVELSSIINRSEDYDIGHVVVSYSDHSQQSHVCPEEELSRLGLLESGYSIIYKIRGTCSAKNNGQDDLQRDAITLLERDYFKFARYSDRIIPDYLTRKFRDRGFLFIGYRPKEWEDRLLVSALLEKRRYAKEEPYYVIGNALQTDEHSSLLESAFWNRSKVNQHPFDFHELNAYLEKASV